VSSQMIDQLSQAVGTEIFVTEWYPITMQNELDFQKATWVHKDFLGFELESNDPYGERLLSGFLLQSLLVAFHKKYLPFQVEGSYALNYGSDRVRFLNPVLAGEEIRCRCSVVSAAASESGGIRLLTRNTIETRADADAEVKTAMIADWITYLVTPQ
jgi:acyl dehydratase